MSVLNIGFDLEKTQGAYFIRDDNYSLVGIHPIGMLLLSTPIQIVAWLSAWAAGLSVDVTTAPFATTRLLAEKVSASFLAALTVIYLYRFMSIIAPRTVSVTITIIYAFGSGSLSLLSQGLWQHTGINLITTIMLYFILSRRNGASRAEEATFFLGVGLLFAIRPTAALWSGLLSILYWRVVQRPRATEMLALTIPVLVALIWNIRTFHHILGGYGVCPVTVFDPQPFEVARRLFLILFSHQRGLLPFHPILCGAFLVLVATKSLPSRERHIILVTASGVFLQLLLCSTNPQWHGGHNFGPRYMLDVLAPSFLLAGLGINYAHTRFPRATTVVVGIIAIGSIALHIFGAIGNRIPNDNLRTLHAELLIPPR